MRVAIRKVAKSILFISGTSISAYAAYNLIDDNKKVFVIERYRQSLEQYKSAKRGNGHKPSNNHDISSAASVTTSTSSTNKSTTKSDCK